MLHTVEFDPPAKHIQPCGVKRKANVAEKKPGKAMGWGHPSQTYPVWKRASALLTASGMASRDHQVQAPLHDRE
jgi:hypothetical protein